jgi:hypothetical protein
VVLLLHPARAAAAPAVMHSLKVLQMLLLLLQALQQQHAVLVKAALPAQQQ